MSGKEDGSGDEAFADDYFKSVLTKKKKDKKKKKKDKKKKTKEKEDKGDSKGSGEESVPKVENDADFDDDGFGGLVQKNPAAYEEDDNLDLPNWKDILEASKGKIKRFEAPSWREPDLTTEFPYTQLLNRIFGKLNDMRGTGKREKPKMPLPDVCAQGSRRTHFTNFKRIVDILKRPIEHVKQFYMCELNCEANTTQEGGIILRGRFRQQQMKSLLVKYMAEFVTCKNCKSPDGQLRRDQATRLYFLVCNNCGAQRSVKPIRSGYQAVNRRERRAARYGN